MNQTDPRLIAGIARNRRNRNGIAEIGFPGSRQASPRIEVSSTPLKLCPIPRDSVAIPRHSGDHKWVCLNFLGPLAAWAALADNVVICCGGKR